MNGEPELIASVLYRAIDGYVHLCCRFRWPDGHESTIDTCLFESRDQPASFGILEDDT